MNTDTSSGKPMATASDDSFTMVNQRLIKGGNIALAACGMIIRRNVFKGGKPIAVAASNCPLSIACIPARTVSPMDAER